LNSTATWQVSEDGISFVALSDISKGDEVSVSYRKEENNLLLFIKYGFIVENAHIALVTLKLQSST
jgi:hypothetical protein